MFAQARPKPSTYASKITTDAIPQAMPNMVSVVRRRLCRMAAYASPSTSWIIVLLLPKRFHRLQNRRFSRGIKTGDNTCHCKTANRKYRGHGHQIGRIESSRPMYRTKQRHQGCCETHTNQATAQGQK